MQHSSSEIQRLLAAMRRYLPLAAAPRGRLSASLRGAAPNRPVPDRCMVTNVFDAGDERGLMCQLLIGAGAPNLSLIIAPVTELSFHRRYPFARDIADYRRRRERERTLNLPRGVKE